MSKLASCGSRAKNSVEAVWRPEEATPAPFMFLYALHDALLKPMPGKSMAPSLAESWSMSPDGLIYEFVLRKGVKFHNGEPVTAEDVKFSFERYRGISAKALKDKVAAVAGDGGGLDRSQEVRREGRRGRLQKGADRGRAVPLRVLHSRRGAGGRGLRRVLAQDAEREAPGVQVRPGHHHAAGNAQARRGGHRIRGQRRDRRGGASHSGRRCSTTCRGTVRASPSRGSGSSPTIRGRPRTRT